MLESLESVTEDAKMKTAICALCKNERKYIIEWIAYHKTQGFDDIYIYDNVSDDGTSELLIILDLLGVIKRVFWPNSTMPQPENRPYFYTQRGAYAHFRSTFSYAYDFVLTIDIDEFIVFENCSLHSFLAEARRRHPSVGAISIPWLLFGTNGHVKEKNGLVIERFITCAPLPANLKTPIDAVKTFYCPKRALVVATHIVHLTSGCSLDNCLDIAKFDKEKKIQFIKWNYGLATIHHYFTKSVEEYIERSNISTNKQIKQRRADVLKNFTVCAINNLNALKRIDEVKRKVFEMNAMVSEYKRYMPTNIYVNAGKIRQGWATFFVSGFEPGASSANILFRALADDRYEVLTQARKVFANGQMGFLFDLSYIDNINIKTIVISIPGYERKFIYNCGMPR